MNENADTAKTDEVTRILTLQRDAALMDLESATETARVAILETQHLLQNALDAVSNGHAPFSSVGGNTFLGSNGAKADAALRDVSHAAKQVRAVERVAASLGLELS